MHTMASGYPPGAGMHSCRCTSPRPCASLSSPRKLYKKVRGALTRDGCCASYIKKSGGGTDPRWLLLLGAVRGRISGGHAGIPAGGELRGRRLRVSRAFPFRNRSIVTEIYLCRACSSHEIEDGNARTG
eukprot:COSAG01_NODE_32865_length_574_cov_0.665263_1_plen_128_part_10